MTADCCRPASQSREKLGRLPVPSRIADRLLRAETLIAYAIWVRLDLKKQPLEMSGATQPARSPVGGLLLVRPSCVRIDCSHLNPAPLASTKENGGAELAGIGSYVGSDPVTDGRCQIDGDGWNRGK